MSYRFPESVIGTTRVAPAGRAGFGDFLDALEPSGRGALLTEGSSWVWETLRVNGRGRRWDICPLVPHVAGYVREATDYGMFGAGLRRLRRISPLSWPRLGIQGLCNARGVLRKDFPTLLTLLLEMEMASFRHVRPPVVFLHPQITDLLLAMDHGQALAKAVERIRRGFGAEPGLATNNLGTLLPRLQSWSVEVPFLVAPVHPAGYGMRPSRESCESVIQSFAGRVLATLDTPLDGRVSTYWKAQGIAGGVYDVAEPNAAEWQKGWKNWRRLADADGHLNGSPKRCVSEATVH
jgi:hypothetical protein